MDVDRISHQPLRNVTAVHIEVLPQTWKGRGELSQVFDLTVNYLGMPPSRLLRLATEYLNFNSKLVLDRRAPENRFSH